MKTNKTYTVSVNHGIRETIWVVEAKNLSYQDAENLRYNLIYQGVPEKAIIVS